MKVLRLPSGLLWQAGSWSKFRSPAVPLDLFSPFPGKLRGTWNGGAVGWGSKGHALPSPFLYGAPRIGCKSFVTASQRTPTESPDATSTSPFADVVGHKLSVRIVLEALRSQRIVQSYVFHGPSGVGKMLVAQRFAAALMERLPGQHQTSDFYCQSGFLGVGDARKLVSFLSKDAWGVRKVVVVRAEGMTEQAANALLLTLEERPGKSVVVILSEDLNKLPKTLVSRCLRVPFRPLSATETHQVLSNLRGSHYLPLVHASAAALTSPGPPPKPSAARARSKKGTGASEKGALAEDRLLSELAGAVVELGRGRPGMAIDAWNALQKVPRDALSVLKELPSEHMALSTAADIARGCNKDNQRWLLLAMMYSNVALREETPPQQSRKGASGVTAHEALVRMHFLENAMRDLDEHVPQEKLWETGLMELKRLSSGKTEPEQLHRLVPLY